jgi:hypothetical protein
MKAFPTLADNGHITTQDGMDLRDYFAAKAMVKLMRMVETDDGFDNDDDRREGVAILAYLQADAMMEARKDD